MKDIIMRVIIMIIIKENKKKKKTFQFFCYSELKFGTNNVSSKKRKENKNKMRKVLEK